MLVVLILCSTIEDQEVHCPYRGLFSGVARKDNERKEGAVLCGSVFVTSFGRKSRESVFITWMIRR
jgi:hypothetical protein